MPLGVAGGALFPFDLFPGSQHCRGILRARLPENMRMPPDHLVMDVADHFRHGEAPFFAGDLRVKNNLQEQIAHLFRELRVASTFEGFHDLVGFFDQVSSQRLMRLLAIPWAPVWSAQSGL